jgi:hypothetical protein
MSEGNKKEIDMPTGYTAAVGEGKVTEFREFAMTCVRAMGVCVTMRDDPSDAAIPDKFEPSDYHEKALAEARKRLKSAYLLSDAECDAAAERSFNEAVAYREKAIREQLETKARYEAMLVKVRSWMPPTSEHANFKAFMDEQLTTSIGFDCSTSYYEKMPERLAAAEWRQKEVESAERDVAYHLEKHQDEIKRANERTEWMRQLRASLNQ